MVYEDKCSNNPLTVSSVAATNECAPKNGRCRSHETCPLLHANSHAKLPPLLLLLLLLLPLLLLILLRRRRLRTLP